MREGGGDSAYPSDVKCRFILRSRESGKRKKGRLGLIECLPQRVFPVDDRFEEDEMVEEGCNFSNFYNPSNCIFNGLTEKE